MTKRGFTASKSQKTKPTATKTTQKKQPAADKESVFQPASTLRLAKTALGILKDNFVTVGFIIIIPSLLYSFGQTLVEPFIQGYASDQAEITNLVIGGSVLMIISSVWLFFTLPTMYYVLARIAHGDSPGIVESYRHGTRFMLRLIGLYALLICLIGVTALLVFPVFIFIRRYILAPFFLVDGDTAIRTAMYRSAAATKPYRWYIWRTLGFAVIVFGVSYMIQNQFKAAGLIVTVPLSSLLFIILALRYREVSTHTSYKFTSTIKQ